MKLPLMNPSHCKWMLTEETLNSYLRWGLEQFKQLIAGGGGQKGERKTDSFCFLSITLTKPGYFETHHHEAARYCYHYAEGCLTVEPRILSVTDIKSCKITTVGKCQITCWIALTCRNYEAPGSAGYKIAIKIKDWTKCLGDILYNINTLCYKPIKDLNAVKNGAVKVHEKIISGLITKRQSHTLVLGWDYVVWFWTGKSFF